MASTTVKAAVDLQSIDQRLMDMGTRLERVERQIGWHGADDSANRNTLKSCDTLAQAIVICEDLRTKYTAHIALGVLTHKAADATNTISAATATNLATCITLANELKEELNDHCALAAAHDVGSTTGLGESATTLALVDFINNVNTADASTLLTELLPLVDDIQRKFRLHTFRGPVGVDESFTI